MKKIAIFASVALFVAAVGVASLQSPSALADDCCDPQECLIAAWNLVVDGMEISATVGAEWCWPSGTYPTLASFEYVPGSADNIDTDEVTFTPPFWLFWTTKCYSVCGSYLEAEKDDAGYEASLDVDVDFWSGSPNRYCNDDTTVVWPAN